MKLLDPKIANDELNQFGLDELAKIHYEIRKNQTEKILSISLSNNDFYKKELNNLDLFGQISIDDLPKYLDVI
jgi:hypothetical protein